MLKTEEINVTAFKILLDDFLNTFEKIKEKMTMKNIMCNKETDNPNFGSGGSGDNDLNLNVGNRKQKAGFNEFNLGGKVAINYNFLEIKGKGHYTTPDPFKFNHHRPRQPMSTMGVKFVHSIKKYPLHQLLNTEHMMNLKNLLRHIQGVISERPLIESENSQICD